MPKTPTLRGFVSQISLIALFAAVACSGSDGSDDGTESLAADDPFSDAASAADAGTEPGLSAEPGSSAEPGASGSAGVDNSDTSAGEGGGGASNGVGGAENAGSADLDAGAPPVLPGGGFITVGVGDAGVVEVLCGSEPCACGDGLDNDNDGLADGSDSECTGPFDHDEGSFATGIPGDNQDPKWQDCFFDGNSGAGDDGCRYHTDCLTGDAELDAPECTTSAECESYCEPLTPPGCDCFGCCQVESLTETLHILVVETCSLENIDDEMACPRCTPTELCQNECGVCEICLGQTLADLPPECFADPPSGGAGSGGGSNGGQGGGASGNAGSANGGSPGSAGSPGSGGLGQGGSGQGGSANPPPAGGGPNEPPPNFCGDGVTSCLTSADCASGAYCSLGCCRPFPAR